MTLREAIKQALTNEDVDLAAKISDVVRYKLKGTYADLEAMVKRAGGDVGEFDNLLYMADCGYSGTKCSRDRWR